MQALKENIMAILLGSVRVSKEGLEKALSLQRKKQLPLRRVLIEEHIISEEELLSILSEQLYIPALHLAKYKFDQEVIRLIPERLARLYNVIPVSRIGNAITVAVSDPLNIFALDDLKNITSCSVDIVLSSEDEIITAIDEQYRSELKKIQDILKEAPPEEQAAKKPDIGLSSEEEGFELTSVVRDSLRAPIVKLLDLILTEALRKRASDIHLEPEEGVLRIRYRIDGSLHDMFRIPKINQNALCARVKIVSGLDITENRLPQDGRFKVRFEGREIDFRVSALPTSFGQKFVLRLLDKSSLNLELERLGFSEDPLRIFKEAIEKPFGMILVTGPTGSGKSTTLYSVLNQLNTPEKNIITIEDPVEYQIEGLTQIQVRPQVGLDFASGLRALLRQSPDVIMIGEIRDSETADIAIKASLTGQIVLATLHTNDAISSITRIIDMGVEPFLIASSLVMLCAQRLLRKICVKCRRPVNVSKDFLEGIGFPQPSQTTFYQSQGCPYCNQTGFYGRIAILEAVMIDDTIREMIIKKDSVDRIKEYALKECRMKTLRDDAFLKVSQGQASLEEALRITTEE